MNVLAACRSVLLAARPFVAIGCVAAPSPAQTPAPELPRLFALGAGPANASTLRIGADGALAGARGAVAFADLGDLVTAGTPLVLAVDRAAPAALVGAVVQRLAAAGAREVLFAGELPGRGERGVLRLALPAAGVADTDLVLTMRHDRPGVAPESLVPLLRRMAVGVDGGMLSVRVAIPGDASFENALQVLAALAATNAVDAVLACDRTPDQRLAGDDLRALARATAPQHGAAALDLGPVPLVQVLPIAVPRPKPAVAATAPVLAAAAGRHWLRVGGSVGGVYGGRGGGAAAAAADAAGQAVASGVGWCTRSQAADGHWAHGSDRTRDVEATAWMLLSLLGDGRTLDTSPELARGVGWLLARQEDGRCIGTPGENAVRAHAIACYALVETYGLSNCPLLRGAIEDALRWLAAQRQPDGGFGNGAPGAPSDAITTTCALCAFASATFFHVEDVPKPADIVPWFDRAAVGDAGAFATNAERDGDGEREPSAVATAGALFAQFFAGRDPREHPRMAQSAQWLLDHATLDDPLTGYWTTYALYQCGGRCWASWNKRLAAMPGQRADGPDAGSFDPAAGASRAVTSALRVLTLQAYYRCTRLVR